MNNIFRSNTATFWSIPVAFFLIMSLKLVWVGKVISASISMGSLLISTGCLFFIIACSLWMKRKHHMWYFSLWSLLLTLLLCGDLAYYQYFSSPLQTYVFQQTSNLSGLGPSILKSLHIYYLLFFSDILLYILLGLFGGKTDKKYGWKMVVISLCVSVIIVAVKPIKVMVSDVDLFQRYNATYFVKVWGPLGHHILDTISFINDSRPTNLSNEEKQQIEQTFSTIAKQNGLKNAYTSTFKGKNIIFVQLESFETFVLNRKVEGKELTPYLNKLLENSYYFDNIHFQTAEGNSSDAEFLSNTALYPIDRGSVFFRFPHNDYQSFGKALKALGYTTSAFHADDATFWNRNVIYPNLGIDTFHDIHDYKMNEYIGMGLGDRSFLKQTATLLSKQKQPFYSLAITLSSHTPFDIPKKHKTLTLKSGLKDTTVGHYLESVHYTDQAVGDFMKALKKKGLLDNSLVVFYGDHIGLFKDSKADLETYIEKGPISDEKWLKEYTKVPFIIYNPSIKGQTLSQIGGQIDINPTVSSLVGVHQSHVLGHNLFNVKDGSALLLKGDYGEKALITQEKVFSKVSPTQNQDFETSLNVIKSDYFVPKK